MIFPKFVNSQVVSFYLHVAGLLSLVPWRPPPPSLSQVGTQDSETGRVVKARQESSWARTEAAFRGKANAVCNL